MAVGRSTDFAGLRSGQKCYTTAIAPFGPTLNRKKHQKREFTIRNVLCAVDLSHHSRITVSRAAQLALSLARG